MATGATGTHHKHAGGNTGSGFRSEQGSAQGGWHGIAAAAACFDECSVAAVSPPRHRLLSAKPQSAKMTGATKQRATALLSI